MQRRCVIPSVLLNKSNIQIVYHRVEDPAAGNAKTPCSEQKEADDASEINQQLKRIAILEAQLAINQNPDLSSATSSKASKSTRSRQSTKASRSSSQLSDQSPLTAATAHSRLDSLEDAMHDIRRLLKTIAINHTGKMQEQQNAPQPPLHAPNPSMDDAPSSPTGEGMTGVQLFPEERGDKTTLAVLSTPTKPSNKRQKQMASPPPSSNLRPQYKEPPGARGGEPC